MVVCSALSLSLLVAATLFLHSVGMAYAHPNWRSKQATAEIPTITTGAPDDPQHHHPKRLLVVFHDHPDDRSRTAGMLPEGLVLQDVINNSPHGSNARVAPASDDLIYVVHVPEGETAAEYIHRVKLNDFVKHVELDAYLYTHQEAATRVRPDDVFYECDGNGNCGSPAKYRPGQQWGLNQIQVPDAWSITKGKKSVKVGIIDSGISLKHEDLQRNVNQACEDFVNGDHTCDEGSIPGNSKGHGTFLAGVIGATTNNSIGVAGVAWNADLIGCTMFSDSCSSENCPGSTSAAIKCLNWLRNDRGVRIVANSYGCSTKSVNFCYSVQFEKAIRAFRDQGGLFIASAGNAGSDNDKVPHYPAGYNVNNVLTVTATGITKNQVFWDSKNPEYLPSFADYGAKTVDIAAPGQDIISTWAPASSMCQGAASCYARISGTSAAVPFVAGLAALIASMPNAPATGVEIKDLILAHADPLPFLKGKVRSGARVNAFRPLYVLAKRAGIKVPLATARPTRKPTRKRPTKKPTRASSGRRLAAAASSSTDQPQALQQPGGGASDPSRVAEAAGAQPQAVQHPGQAPDASR